jgi:hypothetical protein
MKKDFENQPHLPAVATKGLAVFKEPSEDIVGRTRWCQREPRGANEMAISNEHYDNALGDTPHYD